MFYFFTSFNFTENPMVCKERVLEELLMHINCTAEEYFSIFEENEKVLLHTIGVLVELFYKFNHVFLLDIFCEGMNQLK